MQLSRKRKCKNCMLIGARGCDIGLRTETIDEVLRPLEDCYKPITSRQCSDYLMNHKNFHFEMKGAKLNHENKTNSSTNTS